jgi:glycosyltransferase involved in cell wall biosynthesis
MEDTMSKKALIVTRVSGFVPQFEMNNVKILQEMGYEIHYAANFDVVVYGRDNARLRGTGIKRHHIPFGRSPWSRDVWRCYKQLKQLMLNEEFDLIHCHMPMTGVLARKAAERVRRITGRQVPVLYTAHGFHFYKGAPPANWVYAPIEKHYARYTDRLLLINEEDYKRGQRFPVRGEVFYIPGIGVQPMPPADPDFDIHKVYDIPPENRILVSVGELTERKNHELLILAMDRFRRENLTCLICGTGPLEESLRRMVREMHLEDKVIFAGYCEQIPDVLRQADFFAFPSKQEGLPAAMMEAMQAGLPILAQDIRGCHDLIEDGAGGFLFEEYLPEDYVRGIRYFLKYPQEAERMGAWNRERIRAFTIDRVDARMREIYRDLENAAFKTEE